ncbi:YciI family protein [Aeromicrobium sp.]|uniref:YciI family protein n=1 Tax=Aeromicrobium sp. TaxID=1871063 RepID=UPI002FCA6597
MTHYMMSVYGPAELGELGGYASKEEMEQSFADTGAFNEKLQAEGYWVFAGGLAAVSSAAVIDGQGEKTMTTDGPYLETKEHLGGFWIIDAPDEETARRLAAEGSKACRGEVEVRAFEGLG